MKDLACELPRYFNIRHTERGILSKSTRRPGTNLHCIMAFKKLQDSFTAPIFRSPESSGDEPSLSEVEELDSSDSSASGANLNGGRMAGLDDPDGVSQASTSEMGATTSELTSGSVPEDADFDWNWREEAMSTSTPQKNIEVANLTGSKSTSGSPSSVSSTSEPNNETVLDSHSTEHLRRSGTFTKERPTVPVERTRPLSTDSDSSEKSGSWAHRTSEPIEDRGGSGGSLSPPVVTLKRSGTFTKERPTVPERTRPLSTDSDSSEKSGSPAHGASEPDEDRGVSISPTVTLKRSGTFTKERPTVPERTKPLSTDSDSSEKSGSPAHGTSEPDEDRGVSISPIVTLKRSGTFTKERPTVPERTRPLSTDSDSSERANGSLAHGTSEPEEDKDSSGGSFSPVVTRKRSDTFTKDKPSVFSPQSSRGEEEDLDDTLKAADFT